LPSHYGYRLTIAVEGLIGKMQLRHILQKRFLEHERQRPAQMLYFFGATDSGNVLTLSAGSARHVLSGN
jgi:hypothetical protein